MGTSGGRREHDRRPWYASLVTIPAWLTIAIAALVMVFGLYRIYLATRRDDPEQAQPRSGLYRMGKRTHLLIGVVYILLGAGLVATTFGWNPLG
jgi:uncharacterized membrane protein YidH (DUF202 family)